MNISGILVVVSPAECEASISVLNALPGVEVHHSDKETGRIVVTQEAQTVHEEIEGLKRIKGLPSVAMAEMVYHFIDDGTFSKGVPSEVEHATDRAEVPKYLNS